MTQVYGWKCKCQLCMDASNNELIGREWLDYIQHRNDVAIKVVCSSKPHLYFMEDNGTIYLTHSKMTAVDIRDRGLEEPHVTGMLETYQVEPTSLSESPFSNLATL